MPINIQNTNQDLKQKTTVIRSRFLKFSDVLFPDIY
jgi:hypothetical protein